MLHMVAKRRLGRKLKLLAAVSLYVTGMEIDMHTSLSIHAGDYYLTEECEYASWLAS